MVIMMVGVIFIEPDVDVDAYADADAAAELSNILRTMVKTPAQTDGS